MYCGCSSYFYVTVSVYVSVLQIAQSVHVPYSAWFQNCDSSVA